MGCHERAMEASEGLSNDEIEGRVMEKTTHNPRIITWTLSKCLCFHTSFLRDF